MVGPSSSISLKSMPQLSRLDYTRHKLASWSTKLYTCWVLPQFAYLWYRARRARAATYYLIQAGAVGHATYRNNQLAPSLASAHLATWRSNTQHVLQAMQQSQADVPDGLPNALVEVLDENHKRKINDLLVSTNCRGFATNEGRVHSFRYPLETPEALWTELHAYRNAGQIDSANNLCSSERSRLLNLLRALDQKLSSIGDAQPAKDVVLSRANQLYFSGLTALVWGGVALRCVI